MTLRRDAAAAQLADAFGTALVRSSVVTRDAIERPLEAARTSGVPLQDVVIGLGLVTEKTAYTVLAALLVYHSRIFTGSPDTAGPPPRTATPRAPP